MTERVIYLAAGGTGGHLFPALALARALQKRGHKVAILSDSRAANYAAQLDDLEIHQMVSATVFGGSLIKRLLAPFKLFAGLAQALWFFLRHRPAIVLGFGGYPSFCPLIAGRILLCHIAVHEQNAVLGRANKILTRIGARIAASYAGTQKVPFGQRGTMIVTGNPVREKVMKLSEKTYPAPAPEDRFNLLVFGGSQGASVFSKIMPAAIKLLPQEKIDRLRLVQQCRKPEIAETLKAYGSLGIDVELRDFFDDLPERMVKADLVIGRAGASTVSELSILGRPSILVPLPGSLDQDQKANALQMSNHGAAWLVEQTVFKPERIASMLSELMDDPQALTNASKAARSRAIPDATDNLVQFVEQHSGYQPTSRAVNQGGK